MSAKIVHRAGKTRANGDVSARCFKRPRPIDLSRATWTLCAEAVTCPKCLQIAADEERSASGVTS